MRYENDFSTNATKIKKTTKLYIAKYKEFILHLREIWMDNYPFQKTVKSFVFPFCLGIIR